MEMKNIPFAITDWTTVEAVENRGETGTGYWKTCEFNNINVHMVESTPQATLLITGAIKDIFYSVLRAS